MVEEPNLDPGFVENGSLLEDLLKRETFFRDWDSVTPKTAIDVRSRTSASIDLSSLKQFAPLVTSSNVVSDVDGVLFHYRTINLKLCCRQWEISEITLAAERAGCILAFRSSSMTKAVVWAFNAGSPAGSLDSGGAINVESVTFASITVEPASTVDLALQLTDIAKLKFVAVASSRYDGKTKIVAASANAPEVALAGPLILFGSAIGLLGTSIATLKVKNEDMTEKAKIDIIIGGQLS